MQIIESNPTTNWFIESDRSHSFVMIYSFAIVNVALVWTMGIYYWGACGEIRVKHYGLLIVRSARIGSVWTPIPIFWNWFQITKYLEFHERYFWIFDYHLYSFQITDEINLTWYGLQLWIKEFCRKSFCIKLPATTKTQILKRLIKYRQKSIFVLGIWKYLMKEEEPWISDSVHTPNFGP